ncbi:DUF4982 domain-containing protein [Sesbania bispinosa]|nr:DUF4982 domain-containing protein [Sesbania bispinosa]
MMNPEDISKPNPCLHEDWWKSTTFTQINHANTAVITNPSISHTTLNHQQNRILEDSLSAKDSDTSAAQVLSKLKASSDKASPEEEEEPMPEAEATSPILISPAHASDE